MFENWQAGDFIEWGAFAALFLFLGSCIVIGRKRWGFIQTINQRSLSFAEEAVQDRKKILAVLEEIKVLLQDRKT
ncbi:MAG: hypothetical protein B7Z40_21245 [Bosea sp. 12-68-7]|nr:MAG: hypothetical protein B7Z40_21245 [Bosea sp. 12-68-7]OYW98561.1 MAG: hypothetical protein B7Z14_14490 [Bosea sp. 32-68-6]